MENLTMPQIIERLTEWKNNIDCDANSAETYKEANVHCRQSDKLIHAIAILNSIGANNNIHQ